MLGVLLYTMALKANRLNCVAQILWGKSLFFSFVWNTSSPYPLIKNFIFSRKGLSDWERDVYNKWESKKHLGECFNYALDTKYLPKFILARFNDDNTALLNNEMKVSTTY